jgi:spore coat polysaccharide biosynthesis predicted glycosyltransferase SpsG
VIDDLPQRPHDADLLLDQNLPLQDAPAAADRLPPACRTLIGPRFALLRPEFAALRAHRPPRRGDLRRVLVFFSGGDDLGETLKALQGLVLARAQGLLKAEVDAVMGESNPGREAIAELCHAQGWTSHCQTPHMAALVAAADLAIGAGGSSSWERCALGLPALLTVLADNQQGVALALHRAGAARCLGWGADLQPADYAAALAALNPALLARMSESAASLVDGLGSDRVAQALLAAAA